MTLIAVLAIISAIIEAKTREFRKRRHTESHLYSMGATHVGFNPASEPTWVSFAFPSDLEEISLYQSIEQVDFAGASLSDEAIEGISRLNHISCLHMTQGCKVTDTQIALLADNACIEVLRLTNSSVSDNAIPAIASIKCLKSVDLSGTPVTKAGAAKLKNLCPNLVIKY
ncbi:MAG: hypothetical protein AAF664_05075 [Planctomycetota bacterium]